MRQLIFSFKGLKHPMITKWPYTMKIKPNTRRKYAKNLYWLRKEIAKRSDASDEKHIKMPNQATDAAP